MSDDRRTRDPMAELPAERDARERREMAAEIVKLRARAEEAEGALGRMGDRFIAEGAEVEKLRAIVEATANMITESIKMASGAPFLPCCIGIDEGSDRPLRHRPLCPVMAARAYVEGKGGGRRAVSRERAFERIIRDALADGRLRSIEMRQDPGDNEIRALVRVEGADSGERMAIEMRLRVLIAENVSSLGAISVRVETA